MTRPVLIRSPPVTRGQPFFIPEEDQKKGKKVGEVVGGTTAECAAVCCCCPCSVMNLLILGLYKVPTGLCKKAWKRRKRQRLMKKNQGLFLDPAKGESTRAEMEAELDRIVGKGAGDGCNGVVDFEKEMSDRFGGTGFWRSCSQIQT
ncbi:hypothetical protein REPUB_Repub11eG0123900 [Reevesia pubescens]